MSGRWFLTSDLHLGHKNIVKFREGPWGNDIDHHDTELINRWNRTVTPDDTVLLLGDFIMGQKDTTLDYIHRLNGHIILVPGNHDGPWSGNKPAYVERWSQKYVDRGIELWPESLPRVRLEGMGFDVAVSHFPYVGVARHGDRYTEWHPQDDGLVLLHGHVHDAWQVNGRQLNVGADAWGYAPVAVERVADLMREAAA